MWYTALDRHFTMGGLINKLRIARYNLVHQRQEVVLRSYPEDCGDLNCLIENDVLRGGYDYTQRSRIHESAMNGAATCARGVLC